MPDHRTAAARGVRLVLATVALSASAACGLLPSPTPTPAPTPPPPTPTPLPTPTPTPSPLPTPFESNPPDSELVALIPTEVAGQPVVIPAVTDFSITPADIGSVYGELGLQFRAVQLAYVERPRLSLYAVRVQRPFATTEELEPYLAEAGRYVGIAGLDREPWTLTAFGDHLAWWRPEDNATAAGTQIFTWTTGPYLFLMIGVDASLNEAMLAALPGEPPPSPTPEPTPSPAGSGSGAPASEPADASSSPAG